jgi:hypothetical protein
MRRRRRLAVRLAAGGHRTAREPVTAVRISRGSSSINPAVCCRAPP